MSEVPLTGPAADLNNDVPERSKRFKFKRKREDNDDLPHDPHRRYGRHRRRHHRHHRSRRDNTPQVNDDPAAYDDSVSNLPPDIAFRESLFDAMGDDEGAEFWQGVYGQPIHEYPNTFQNQQTGELEQLNEEEYAAYVRRKMWERSWEGIEAAREEKRRQTQREERERRDESKTSHKTNQDQGPNNDFLFDLEIENSLKRGERRRDKKKWKALWQAYLQQWSELLRLSEKRDLHTQQFLLRNKLPWPVESGKRKDLDAQHIEQFLRNCADAVDDNESASNTFRNMLKVERIRFHPDKIQQRYGFMEIDSNTMEGVTAVFQVLDHLWNEVRRTES